MTLTCSHLTFQSHNVGFQTKAVISLPKVHIVEIIPHEKKYGFSFGVRVTFEDGIIWFEFLSASERAKFRDFIKCSTKIVELTAAENIETQPNNLFLEDLHQRDLAFSQATDEITATRPMRDNRIAAPASNIPLRISLLTIGSRGDIQPMIALGKGLSRKGHFVKIATHGEYKGWIESHGLQFVPIAGNPSDIIQVCVEKGLFTLSFIKEAFIRLRGWIDELFESALVAMQGSDLIIESTVALIGYHVAEKMQIPYMATCTMPWSRTSEFPHPFAVSEYLGLGYNRITWYLMETVLWRGLQYNFNKFRREKLGLNSISSGNWLEIGKIPLIYNFSQHVVRKPRDWGPWIHLSGYWFLDASEKDWKPEPALLEFISDRNIPIVYIGFGSMVVADPDELTRTIVSAVNKAGVKAVICKGWSSRNQNIAHRNSVSSFNADPNIFFVTSVPHDWLFPKMDAVVHHGGAGTTAAGLRFGIPTIIKPFFGDQYFWASRVVHLGVGCWAKRLESQHMSDCIREAVFDENIKKRANKLGALIRSEDGVDAAIMQIEKEVPVLRSKLEFQKETPRETGRSYRRKIRNSLWSLRSGKSERFSLKSEEFELEPVNFHNNVESNGEHNGDIGTYPIQVHNSMSSPKDFLIKIDDCTFFTSIHSQSSVSTNTTNVITTTVTGVKRRLFARK